jgi:hypothetical protein
MVNHWVLRKIRGLKREKVTREQRRPCKKDLYDLKTKKE